MKKKLLMLAACCSVLFSCSSDDSGSGDNAPVNFTIPLNNGKYWTYDVKTNEDLPTRDSLYISGDSLINGVTYKRFETRDNLATGFYSSSLRNNGVRESDNKLLLTGDLSLAAGQQLPLNLDLTLTDFIIFKKNATVDELLSSITDSFQQDVNGYPLTITYTLRSYGGETLSTFTPPSPNTTTYSNVKTSKIKLNATVTTQIPGVPLPITVLSDQTILSSTQYVADQIGMVYTNTVTSYSINESIAAEIGIDPNGTQTQQEFLDNHN
ncbi:hypothetical protein ABGT15_03385 [Flavobacterium enshiense]|uniref:hypothetical protein n=1 Tax=Flavobacterium enshiense TaxID=1341165 RepID=UPI00345C6C1A